MTVHDTISLSFGVVPLPLPVTATNVKQIPSQRHATITFSFLVKGLHTAQFFDTPFLVTNFNTFLIACEAYSFRGGSQTSPTSFWGVSAVVLTAYTLRGTCHSGFNRTGELRRISCILFPRLNINGTRLLVLKTYL